MKNFKPDIDIQVCGKWILAGEHSVLRGGNALVFPLQSRYLGLQYFRTDSDFEISFISDNHAELDLIIWSVIEKALKKLNVKRQNLRGLLKFDSKILFGAGMGASATLCVALTRLFHQLGYLSADLQYDFATDLENLFHGESSGVDVAVTLFNRPLLFSRRNGYQLLQNYQKPSLYLSHTGARGVTKDCIDKVKKLLIDHSEEAQAIDEQMKAAVAQFQILLSEPSLHADWVKALDLAHNCFQKWGLVNEAVMLHESQLRKCGAEAVKLTGSGGGGFMLSYWKRPPSDVTFDLISCFN